MIHILIFSHKKRLRKLNNTEPLIDVTMS